MSFYILDIEKTDQNWYTALTNHLTAEQQKTLQEIILLADQRKAALESKRIEQSGGKNTNFYYYYIYCVYIFIIYIYIFQYHFKFNNCILKASRFYKLLSK